MSSSEESEYDDDNYESSEEESEEEDDAAEVVTFTWKKMGQGETKGSQVEKDGGSGADNSVTFNWSRYKKPAACEFAFLF